MINYEFRDEKTWKRLSSHAERMNEVVESQGNLGLKMIGIMVWLLDICVFAVWISACRDKGTVAFQVITLNEYNLNRKSETIRCECHTKYNANNQVHISRCLKKEKQIKRFKN